jgi:hypothetical protein
MNFKALIAVCTLSLAGTVNAGIINSANVGSLTTFQDTNTGRTWLDLNNFFDAAANNGTTGFDMISIAAASGFTIANRLDLNQLFSGLPLSGGQWSSYASIMGFGAPRSLIWGMYEGSTSPNYPYAWAFNGDSQWNFGGNIDANTVVNAGISGAVDMGLWAYSTGSIVSAVPEPETYAMLLAGLGLMGGIARRRKQKRANA